jgi:hypothetical protein
MMKQEYTEQWKSKYSLDVIGTSYCRSRTIPCSAKEFEQMKAFKNARQVFCSISLHLG